MALSLQLFFLFFFCLLTSLLATAGLKGTTTLSTNNFVRELTEDCANFQNYYNTSVGNTCKNCVAVPNCAWCFELDQCFSNATVSTACYVVKGKTGGYTGKGTICYDSGDCAKAESASFLTIVIVVSVIVFVFIIGGTIMMCQKNQTMSSFSPPSAGGGVPGAGVAYSQQGFEMK